MSAHTRPLARPSSTVEPRLQALLAALADPAAVCDERGDILVANAPFEGVLGERHRALFELVEPASRPVFERALPASAQLGARGGAVTVELDVCGRPMRVGVADVADNPRRVLVTFRPLRVQSQPVELPAHGPDRRFLLQAALNEALASVAAGCRDGRELLGPILDVTGFHIAILWSVDGESRQLQYAHAAVAPGVDGGVFVERSSRTHLGWGEGLAGRVWAAGRASWVDVYADDAAFPRSSAARESGLGAAIGFPVRVGERIIGVVELFSQRRLLPDAGLVEVLGRVGDGLGHVVERAHAERSRREGEEQLRLITDALPALIGYIDADRRYRFCNRAYEEWLGTARDDFLGRPMRETLGDALYAQLEPHVTEVLRGKTVTFEAQLPHRDGSWRACRASYVPHVDGRGAVVGFAVLMVDLTDEKRATEDARASERQLRQLAEAAPQLVWACSPKGDVRYVNGRFAEFTGCDLEESQPLEWLGCVHADDVVHARARWTRSLATGDGFECEFRLRRADGVWRWHLGRAVAMRDELGQITLWIGTATDVEDHKRVEEQLRQSLKMEAIGRLAGGVAHDFNNLLTAIIGHADLLLEAAEADEALKGGLEEIKNAGERAAGLTRQLLAYSRKQVLSPRVLQVNQVVEDLDRMLRRLIGEDIELHLALSEELGHVRADRGQLEQVLLNLAVNARDAMPSGGKLTVETANLVLDDTYQEGAFCLPAGCYVMLAITDTGVGMDEDTRQQVFEPFFTTKEAGKGTGLGLSTVYGIVRQSGGHVVVYSEVGHGTVFKVYLPRVEADAQLRLPVGPPVQRRLSGNETVLLVEDEESVRALMRKVLEAQGYRVLLCARGDEALKVAAAHDARIHLLVTDVVLGGMSGRELAERLQPLRPHMKLLYISGYTDDAIVRHGVLESNAEFLNKPFAPNTLALRVRQILDGAARASLSAPEP